MEITPQPTAVAIEKVLIDLVFGYFFYVFNIIESRSDSKQIGEWQKQLSKASLQYNDTL